MTIPQVAQIDQRLKQPAHDDLRSLLSQIRASNPRNRTHFHGRGKVLFAEAEPARGVYVLRTGSAAVSVCSSEGRVVILRVAHAGEALGLNCVLSNSFHDTREACAVLQRFHIAQLQSSSRVRPVQMPY
jgi:CRP-like cAMP-binding protein